VVAALTLAWSFVNAHEDLGRHSPPKPARVSLIENDPPTDSFGTFDKQTCLRSYFAPTQ